MGRILFKVLGLMGLIGLMGFMGGVMTSCGEKHHGPLPELNIDSLFIDLGKANVAKRTAMAEKTFK